jgi:hypothetical protein
MKTQAAKAIAAIIFVLAIFATFPASLDKITLFLPNSLM